MCIGSRVSVGGRPFGKHRQSSAKRARKDLWLAAHHGNSDEFSARCVSIKLGFDRSFADEHRDQERSAGVEQRNVNAAMVGE